MVATSKLFPPKISSLTCQELLHPWAKTCRQGHLKWAFYALIGSGQIQAFYHIFKYTVNLLKKKDAKFDLTDYLRSTLVFSSNGTLYLMTACALRRLLGQFYYLSIVFLPALVAGIPIFYEKQKNKELYSTVYANLVLQLWVKQLEDSKTLNWTSAQKTYVFMVISSLLSYLMVKCEPGAVSFWFFNSKSEPHPEDKCHHRDTCKRNAINHFLKYLYAGSCLELMKVVLSNVKQPSVIANQLLCFKTYKLALFWGSYAALYQIVKCVLRWKIGHSSEFHDAVAGFLAGATFCLQPNITTLNSAIITIAQILTHIGCKQGIMPNLPYSDLTFIYGNALLFHSRYFYPQQMPKLMMIIITMATGTLADNIAQVYLNIFKNIGS